MDFLAIIKKSNEKIMELLNRRVHIKLRRESLLEGDTGNYLYNCDNLTAILELIERGYEGEIDLIYIDPPFLTNKKFYSKSTLSIGDQVFTIEYLDYNDIWNHGLDEFLEILTIRLILLKRLLSKRGSIYVHLDFRTSHYTKIIMDYIYGSENFINEIIWSYRSGGSSDRYFSRKHDSLLYYSKGKDYIFNPSKEKSYNRGLKAYGFKDIEEYKDEHGWYTLVNYRDVWDINMVGRTSKERQDYRTQKPERLLEKIILSSSHENSLVADFFAGSGTTLAVANKHNRRWIGCDNSNTSIYTIRNRIDRENYKFIYEDKGNNQVKTKEKAVKIKDNLEVELTIDKYEIDTSFIRKKDRGILDLAQEKNSLGLIDYISIGYIYGDMDIICNEEYNLKGLLNEGDLRYYKIGYKSLPLFINFMDIFGNTSRKVLKF